MSNQDLAQKAKEYAFLLLKFRLRSENEIFLRLKKKKFSEEIILNTLDFLKEKDFLNDVLFAKSWIEARLKRPFGIRRIKQELKLKGLDKEIIEASINELKDSYSEEEVVNKLAAERLGKLKGVEPVVAKSRVYAYLLRRGFSMEVVSDVINQLCKRTH